jgi:hypothetical protein
MFDAVQDEITRKRRKAPARGEYQCYLLLNNIVSS